ncbi:MAG: excinuclease ABC subunit UvrA [Synergistetes bacterium]|nr:excinuclease ABC subunit UvrA [Synergistota bacterium]MCX8128057.1 excinuclease ABC subunit UvrA [Synergistota bacterium]MDW8193095.1 excinuclease ABC subunit UvrA [Synergistota bacterium]
MSYDNIVIRGAREHNLKNINLELPKGKLIVVTGVSGSGKSSLAFDTIYAEGQRRYVESLSAYARQFLGRMEKPDVDSIEGLSPAISIDQKGVPKNPRSTVGTITEIYDYLRLLFARIGIPHCFKCGRVIERQTVDHMVEKIFSLPAGTRIQILSPLVRGRKGEFKNLFIELQKGGFLRVRVDGITLWLEEEITLDKAKKHDIDVIIDRLIVNEENKSRIYDSLEQALRLSKGLVLILVGDGEEILLSERFACPYCEVSLPEIEPRLFSFNSPYGACSACDGLGVKIEFAPDLIIDEELSICEGAVRPWRDSRYEEFYLKKLEVLAKEYGFSLGVPFKNLPEDIKNIILYGSDKVFSFKFYSRDGAYDYRGYFEGVIPQLERKYRETESEVVKEELERFMRFNSCPKCKGARLREEALAVKIAGKNIYELTCMPIRDLYAFLKELRFSEKERQIARVPIKEILSRLDFLINVGVGYLTLARPGYTLSGGEAQRIRLATQIGSGLTGVLYVLDEPTVGLHPRDTERLLNMLEKLRDMGNTLLVVEHDELTIRRADYIVELGPGAGVNGGEVVYQGTLDELLKSEKSLTGAFLSGRKRIPVPSYRRRPGKKNIVIKGARHHNLKNIDVIIPLGLLVCITGVSGAGKSTLVYDILYKALVRKLYRSPELPGEHDSIEGLENIDKVVLIDQSPIGRTPRSNPVTYTGAFTPIREFFSLLPEAKIRGYEPGRFSFNVRGGRCEACQGQGTIKVEMQFLPDVYITCDVCKGKRYNRETLEVKYKGKDISDVLDMSVDEALEFFSNIPSIVRKLRLLSDVGLGYIKLGQSATTLSGGEAQRVKLAAELSKKPTGKTLYILDEPTTGLHFADVEKLVKVLQRLVEGGNTVLVIEHNLEVVKVADYVIDLGPEGGEEGGYIVACGTPEEIAMCEKSYTGQFLKKVLGDGNKVYAESA